MFKQSPLQLNSFWIRKFLFCSILITGIILRLYKWNSYSFWYDEAGWLLICQGALLTSLKGTIVLFKPPLFNFLIYFWAYIGQNEFNLRLLSFIFGILSIILIYKVGKLLFDEKVGLISAFLISFSPFHIYYSQELTQYTLMTFLALCSVYYLICSLKGNNVYSWVKFIFFTSLSLYSSYVFFFLIIMENLFFFFLYARYGKFIRRWLLSQLAILLLYSPWLMMISAQFSFLSFLSVDSQLAVVGWVPEGSLAHIFQTLRLFNVGYNADFIVQFFACLLFFPLLLAGIIININKEKEKIWLLILWLFIPMILSILFSKIIHTFTYRNFILAMPAYYILIASGMVKFKRYIYAPILFFMLLYACSLLNYYRNVFPYPENFYRPGVHAKIDNRTASKYIISNLKEGDAVINTCRNTILPYVYYRFVSSYNSINELREFSNNLLVNAPIEENKMLDFLASFLASREEEVREFTKIHNNKRIWLVFSAWEPQEPSIGESEVKKWLDNHWEAIDHKKFSGIDVYLYEKPIS